MKTYKLTLKHDHGKVRITVKAENEQKAKELVMKSENCPERAIVKIQEYIKPLSIYDIKRLTAETSPYFFSPKTMRFFGQTMAGFSVVRMQDGRTRISQRMPHGLTVRYFNPLTNELETE